MEEPQDREEERESRLVSKKVGGRRSQQGQLSFFIAQSRNQPHEREQGFRSYKIKSKSTSHQKGVLGFAHEIKCAIWQILDVYASAIGDHWDRRRQQLSKSQALDWRGVSGGRNCRLQTFPQSGLRGFRVRPAAHDNVIGKPKQPGH